MPAATLSREEILGRLADTFRQRGYDGASLSDIAKATGLGKSSLYHYFPGGKEEMATGVLGALGAQLEAALFAPLEEPGAPARKLGRMLEAIDAFYDGGRKACLLERLTASANRAPFQRPLRAVFERWIDAIAGLSREAGIPTATARARAEDAVVRIEGALVLSAGTGDHRPFGRALKAVRGSLLVPPAP
jgi:TetR/AcrR family transcriptional repressor of lmrAB and yxaGH operons